MTINIPVYCSMLAPHPPPSTGPNCKKWRAKEKFGNLHWFVSQIIYSFYVKYQAKGWGATCVATTNVSPLGSGISL